MNNNDIKSIQKKDGYVFDNCLRLTIVMIALIV